MDPSLWTLFGQNGSLQCAIEGVVEDTEHTGFNLTVYGAFLHVLNIYLLVLNAHWYGRYLNKVLDYTNMESNQIKVAFSFIFNWFRLILVNLEYFTMFETWSVYFWTLRFTDQLPITFHDMTWTSKNGPWNGLAFPHTIILSYILFLFFMCKGFYTSCKRALITWINYVQGDIKEENLTLPDSFHYAHLISCFCDNIWKFIGYILDAQSDMLRSLMTGGWKRLNKYLRLPNILEQNLDSIAIFTKAILFAYSFRFTKIKKKDEVCLFLLIMVFEEPLIRHRAEICEVILQRMEELGEMICDNYLKIPSHLEPNRYHTIYRFGIHFDAPLLEYGIHVHVLPCGCCREGVRHFYLLDALIFAGESISVPCAPAG